MTHRTLAAPILGLLLAACSATTPAADPSLTGSPAGDPTPSRSEQATDPSATPTAGAEPSADPSASGTSSPAQPAPQGPVEPPDAGTYTYRQDGTTKAGAFSFDDDVEGTLRVEPASADGRQVQTRSFSDQSIIEQALRFTQDGVLLERFTSRFFTSSLTCELKTPMLVIEDTDRPGATWKDSGSCDGRSITAKGTLVKAEQRNVGGERVATLKLRLTLTIKGGGLDQTTQTTAWVSPEHRLIVRSITHGEGTADGQSFTQDRTDDLVSLAPA